MATTVRKAVRIATEGTQPKGLRAGLVAVTGIYSLTTSLTVGDTIQMVKVPAGATLVYAALNGGSGDALVALGDGIDDDRYTAYVTMAAATQTVVRGITTYVAPYTYSVDDTIDITVSVVSVSTLIGGFHLTAIFSMDT